MIGYLNGARPTGAAATSRRRCGTSAAPLTWIPSATRAVDALGDVNLVTGPLRPAPPTATGTTSRSTTARRACSTSSRSRSTTPARRGRDRRAQKAVALDDRFAEAYYLLGLCQRDVQRPDAARVALEQAVAIQPALLPLAKSSRTCTGRSVAPTIA